MSEQLSETEMNEIDRRILKAERLDVHVVLPHRLARALLEQAKQATFDEQDREAMQSEIRWLREKLEEAQWDLEEDP